VGNWHRLCYHKIEVQIQPEVRYESTENCEGSCSSSHVDRICHRCISQDDQADAQTCAYADAVPDTDDVIDMQ